MEITEAEIQSLLQQLETVRCEKHEIEEARAMGAKQRDKKIEELVSDNHSMREQIRNLTEKLAKSEQELSSERKEMSLLEAGLFRAKSEVRALLKQLLQEIKLKF